jgi:hypothetical protein
VLAWGIGCEEKVICLGFLPTLYMNVNNLMYLRQANSRTRLESFIDPAINGCLKVNSYWLKEVAFIAFITLEAHPYIHFKQLSFLTLSHKLLAAIIL